MSAGDLLELAIIGAIVLVYLYLVFVRLARWSAAGGWRLGVGIVTVWCVGTIVGLIPWLIVVVWLRRQRRRAELVPHG